MTASDLDRLRIRLGQSQLSLSFSDCNNIITVILSEKTLKINAVEWPRIYIQTLDKCENPNFRSKLKTNYNVSCLGFRS